MTMIKARMKVTQFHRLLKVTMKAEMNYLFPVLCGLIISLSTSTAMASSHHHGHHKVAKVSQQQMPPPSIQVLGSEAVGHWQEQMKAVQAGRKGGEARQAGRKGGQ